MTSLHPTLQITLLVLLAPLVGALIAGVDRKITARMQGRIGPPVLQPFFDVVKLLHKEPIVVNRIQVVYAFLHLAFMALSLILLVLGQDSLMFLFVFAFSTLALVLGGMCVRSPYSRIGSQREILLMVAYEPILILLMIGMYLAHGTFLLASPISAERPMIATLPLIFVAVLVVLAIKLQKSPFDLATSHHAHQEIIKGLTIEYAGPYLAILEIAHFYEIALLFYLITLFWASSLLLGALLACAAFFLMMVVDNAFARLTSIWTFRFLWGGALVLAITNVLWLYF